MASAPSGAPALAKQESSLGITEKDQKKMQAIKKGNIKPGSISAKNVVLSLMIDEDADLLAEDDEFEEFEAESIEHAYTSLAYTRLLYRLCDCLRVCMQRGRKRMKITRIKQYENMSTHYTRKCMCACAISYSFVWVCLCVVMSRSKLWGDNWDDDEVGDDDFSKQLRAELAKKPASSPPPSAGASSSSSSSHDMKDG